jgi:hypothetical protein
MSEPQHPLAYESPGTRWTGVSIGTIALQLLGIYCFVLALPLVSYFVVLFTSWQYRTEWMIGLGPFAAYIAAGIVLIRYADRLSGLIFRGGAMVGPIDPAAARELQAVAFSVVGVVVMIHAAPEVIGIVGRWFIAHARGWGELDDRIWESVIKLAAGLALFLHARGLALLWQKIRAPQQGTAAGPATRQPPRSTL